jgi:prepilin peptidase CpaA
MTTAQVAALVVAVAACVTDLSTRRIPNVLTFGSAAAAFVYHTGVSGASGLGFGLAGFALGAVLFVPLFVLGGMGAGDVKLLAAFGAWLGPGDVIWVALYGSIAGGIAAVIVGLARGYLRRAFQNVYSLLMFWRIAGVRPMPELTLDTAHAPRLAYAVPLFAGLAVTLWLKQ